MSVWVDDSTMEARAEEWRARFSGVCSDLADGWGAVEDMVEEGKGQRGLGVERSYQSEPSPKNSVTDSAVRRCLDHSSFIHSKIPCILYSMPG
jgi:hypothetical protein